MENIPGPLDASMDSAPVMKKRGNLPKAAVHSLFTWLRDHQENAYPSEEEKLQFAKDNGISLEQVSNWFINARRRYLPRLLKESGKNPEDYRITRKKSKSSKLCNNHETDEESNSSNDVHQRVLKIHQTSAYSNIGSEFRIADLENSEKTICDNLILNSRTDKVCNLTMVSCSADIASFKEKAAALENYRKHMYEDLILNRGTDQMYSLALTSCLPDDVSFKERTEDIENNPDVSNRDSNNVNFDELSRHCKSSVKRKSDSNCIHRKCQQRCLEDDTLKEGSSFIMRRFIKYNLYTAEK